MNATIRTLFIFLTNAVLLALIFYNCPLKLSRRTAEGMTWDPPLPANAAAGNPAWVSPAQKLLELEQQKGSTQISGSVTSGNEWFHIKFVMIGALIAGFLWKSGFVGKDNLPGRTLSEILKLNETCMALALATAVALMIDMQNRQMDCTNKQIGLWMTHYLEPAMLGLNAAPAAVTNPHPSGLGPDFLAWEQFLRVPGAMHTDLLHAGLLSLFGNFPTWGIFFLYLAVFQRVRADKEQQAIQWVGFAMVHLLLVSFAVVAHTAPGVFTLVLPWGPEVSARCAWVWFFAFGLLLTAFNWRWVPRGAGAA